jgi:PST family polysaccharide transporter
VKSSFGARGAAFTLGGQWVQYGIQFVSLMVLSRALDPAAFGLVAVVTSVVVLASTLSDFGLSQSCLRAAELSAEQRSNVFWINVAAGGVLCLALNAIASPLAYFYGDVRLESLCRVMSSVFVISGIGAQYRVGLMRDGLFGPLALSGVISATVGLLSALAGARLGLGAMALVIQQVAAALVGLVIVVAARPWLPLRPKRGVGTRGIVAFGGVLFLTTLMNAVSSSVDALTLKSFHSNEEVGLYSRSLQISRQPMTQLVSPLSRLAIPRAARAGAEPLKQLASLRRLYRPVAFTCALGLSLVVAASDLVTTVFLGGRWVGAGLLVGVLALASMLQTAQQIMYWMLMVSGRARVLFLSEFVPRVAYVALVVLVARHAVVLVCLCAVLMQLMILVVDVFWGMPRIGVRWHDALKVAMEPVGFFLGTSCVMVTVRSLHSSLFPGWVSADLVGLTVWVASMAVVMTASQPARHAVARGLRWIVSWVRRIIERTG